MPTERDGGHTQDGKPHCHRRSPSLPLDTMSDRTHSPRMSDRSVCVCVCLSACLPVCEPPVCDECTDGRLTHSREQTSQTGHSQTDGNPNTAPHILCLSVCHISSAPHSPAHTLTAADGQHAKPHTIQHGTLQDPPRHTKGGQPTRETKRFS